jgi:Cell Wall Hydrolase
VGLANNWQEGDTRTHDAAPCRTHRFHSHAPCSPARGSGNRCAGSIWPILCFAVIATTAPHARAQTTPFPIEDRAQALECLTLAIAHEAGHESPEGQQAVAEVVLNRVRHPAFPKSVCGVVFAGSTLKTGCQFTFTCDGSLRRRLSDKVMAQARAVAEQAIDGRLTPLVADALNYHADYVSPYWAPSLDRVTKIGAHIFYRRRGGPAPAIAAPNFAGAMPAAAAASAAPPPPFAPWGLAPQPPVASPQPQR